MNVLEVVQLYEIKEGLQGEMVLPAIVSRSGDAGGAKRNNFSFFWY